MQLASVVGPQVVFAFSGCMPICGEYVRALAHAEPVFERALLECDAQVAKEIGWSIRTALMEIPPGKTIVDLPQNFPMVVALQVAICALMKANGLQPKAVIGLSSGEVSSAYAAGAISLRDALLIAVHGGRLMQAEAALMRMILVWLPASECLKQLEPFGLGLAIAGQMEPGVTVVSGLLGDIDELLQLLQKRGVRNHALPFPWGVHMPLIASARVDFENAMASMQSRKPTLPIVSSSLGRWAGGGDDFSVTHWWHLFQSPVKFQTAASLMIHSGKKRFVEIGPDSAMQYLIPVLGGESIAFEDALAQLRHSP